MADMFDVQSKRGSIRHRWALISTRRAPALNDQYAGLDPWAAFLDAIEARTRRFARYEAARSEGANQFKVNFDPLKQAWSKNEWIKKNTLIAVAGGEKDGTSGLRDATASFEAQRKNVERLAHIVFNVERTCKALLGRLATETAW